MSYKEVLLQLNSKQKSAFWLGAAINSCPLSRAVHVSRDSVLKELTWKWRKNSAFPRRKISSSCLTIHVSLKIMWPTLCDKTSLLTNCYFTRHSTMLVGQTGSGKSVCWKILQASMTRLKRDGDSSFNVVRVSPTDRESTQKTYVTNKLFQFLQRTLFLSFVTQAVVLCWFSLSVFYFIGVSY